MFIIPQRYISLVKNIGRSALKKDVVNCGLFSTYLQGKSCHCRSFNMKYSTSSENHTSEENKLNFQEIVESDKEAEHKLKVILLEAEVMRQEGKPVPETSAITKDQWKEILNMQTRSARRKYFEYLFKLSKKKENRKAKQLEKRLQREEFKKDEPKENKTFEDFATTYDLSHNNIFLRFYDTTINQMYNSRLIQAMMFGQKLVVDCGYEENMTQRENSNCAKQLMFLFAENRVHDDPFDLHLCNLNTNGTLLKKLHNNIPKLFETSFPLNIHESSYLDLFPKDQLVYLTPHCQSELTEYDHDAVYIIGAIVDKVNNEPLSLAKAKKEGLKMKKLPLDKYLNWGAGSGKSLTLNQVLCILNDVKYFKDWEYALRHVPRRKIIEHTVNVSNFNKRDHQKFSKFADKRPDERWIPSSNVDIKSLLKKRQAK